LEVWNTVTIESIVKMPRQLVKSGSISLSGLDFSSISYFNKTLFRKGGLDSTPLYTLIRDSVDEEVIKKNGIDLGIVTLEVGKLTNVRPLEIFYDQMEPGSLADYLLASASFPAFEDAEFNNRKFTDGGLHNNVPHSMMKDRGYKDIVVVDVSGLGMNRKPDVEGTTTTYIKNSLNMGGVLDFSRSFLEDYGELGYLDTLRTYGRLDGVRYFIKPDSPVDQNLLKGFEDGDIRKQFELLFPNEKGLDFAAHLRTLVPKEFSQRRAVGDTLLECMALSMNIPRNREYTRAELKMAIQLNYERIESQGPLPMEGHFIRLKNALEEALWKHLPEQDENISAYEYAKRAGLLNLKKHPPLVLKAYHSLNHSLAGAVLYSLILFS